VRAPVNVVSVIKKKEQPRTYSKQPQDRGRVFGARVSVVVAYKSDIQVKKRQSSLLFCVHTNNVIDHLQHHPLFCLIDDGDEHWFLSFAARNMFRSVRLNTTSRVTPIRLRLLTRGRKSETTRADRRTKVVVTMALLLGSLSHSVLLLFRRLQFSYSTQFLGVQCSLA